MLFSDIFGLNRHQEDHKILKKANKGFKGQFKGQRVKKWKNIDVLINNAGNAHGFDFIHEGNDEDWDKMIDINVKGLLYVSKEIIKNMVKNKNGHIINIGSIAGKEVYPKGNVYCASKFAVDAISQGMRIDLNNYNIKVSQINPGLVKTEFSLVRFKNDLERAKAVYDYLINNGVSAKRMTFKGFGANKPITSNNSEEGRAINRRTAFKIK